MKGLSTATVQEPSGSYCSLSFNVCPNRQQLPDFAWRTRLSACVHSSLVFTRNILAGLPTQRCNRINSSLAGAKLTRMEPTIEAFANFQVARLKL